MGDLIADAQAWKGGTQIAFMNPGGIRADIAYATYPHDITLAISLPSSHSTTSWSR